MLPPFRSNLKSSNISLICTEVFENGISFEVAGIEQGIILIIVDNREINVNR